MIKNKYQYGRDKDRNRNVENMEGIKDRLQLNAENKVMK
jgi:hypothetical protein